MTIVDAIRSLRPGAEFVITGDSLETLIWHTEGVAPISQSDIDAELAKLEQEAAAKNEANIAARADAIALAKSLGFTNDMIAVMYPNLVTP